MNTKRTLPCELFYSSDVAGQLGITCGLGLAMRVELTALSVCFFVVCIGEQSIVMNMSLCVCLFVCLSVCLSVRSHISGTTRLICTSILCGLPMVVARSHSCVAIRYELPVLWITS